MGHQHHAGGGLPDRDRGLPKPAACAAGDAAADMRRNLYVRDDVPVLDETEFLQHIRLVMKEEVCQ